MITPAQANSYFFWKLPAAWWTGVRVKSLNLNSCTTQVRYQWINQNPFRSMFWAVQGMAAEVATGMLLKNKLDALGLTPSMLLIANEGKFSKKAVGRIRFECNEAAAIAIMIEKLQNTTAPQTLWLTASGVDEQGDEVAAFKFHWTLKNRTHGK
jgi:hypothetical protein